MPFIPDQQGGGSWDDVTLLTRQDPVDAGENGEGIANDQAKQLANRTRFLRDLAEQLGTDLQTVTDAFNGHLNGADPHAQYVTQTSYDNTVAAMQATIDELKTGLVWQEKADNFDVELLESAIARYRVDTTAGQVLGTLPLLMEDGQSAIFVDQGDAWDNYPLLLVAPQGATYTLEGGEPFTKLTNTPAQFAASGLDYGPNGVGVTLSGDSLTARIDLTTGGGAEEEVSGARLVTFDEHYTGKRWLLCTLVDDVMSANTEAAIGDRGPAAAGTLGVTLTAGGLTSINQAAVIDGNFSSGDSVLLEFDFDAGTLRMVTAAVDVTDNGLVFDGVALDAYLHMTAAAANGEIASVTVSADELDLPAWATPANDSLPLQTVTAENLTAVELNNAGAIIHLIYDQSEDKVAIVVAAESNPLSQYVAVAGNIALGAEHNGKTLYITADADITLPALADFPRGFEVQITPSQKATHAINLVTTGGEPVRDNETIVLGDASVSRSPDGLQYLAIGEVQVAV